MSLRELCGQLLVVGFAGTHAPHPLLDALRAGERGGVILFKRNIPAALVELPQLVATLAEVAPSGAPLLVGVDQEGGRVARIGAPALRLPPAARLAAALDADALARVAEHQSRQLRALGFTMNFAPVLDVHTNPANPIIGDRSFGTDAASASRAALAFARGMGRAGLLACGKHFPGHGDTTKDSHLDLPEVPHDRARLDAVELAPFRAAAEARLPALMTAHVLFPALDSVPATLSRRIVHDLLRHELGFDGVVISDDLEMKAIADRYGYGDAAVRAIEAGCDVLLVCSDFAAADEAHRALVDRATADAAFRARCEDAHRRFLAMRATCPPQPLLRQPAALAELFEGTEAYEVQKLLDAARGA
jgi:beta-N-acetylhexosaminidase